MKTIFKILSVLICLFFCMNNATAQTFTSELKVGLTMAEMDMPNANMYKTPKYGFSLNLLVGYRFSTGIQFQTGFIMTKRGSRKHEDRFVRDDQDNYTHRDVTTVIDANYMMIPLTIGYERNITKSLAFNINAGMYGARGFKGKSKTEGVVKSYVGNVVLAESTINEEWDTFSPTCLKRLDYGALANASLIYSNVILTVGYEYGLMNISNSSQEMKNRNLSVALGLRF